MKVVDFRKKRCPNCGIRFPVNRPICKSCGRSVDWLSYLRACWPEFLIVAVLIGLMVILLVRLVWELSEPRNPEPPLVLPQYPQSSSSETDQSGVDWRREINGKIESF